MSQLGPLATPDEIGNYVKQHHGYTFKDRQDLEVYITMVERKMSRKPRKGNMSPSGMFSVE
jgi:hypothetical protein